MSTAHSLPITVGDDWLAMQSAGSLSPFKQLLLTCQADMEPRLRPIFASDDHVAGALLESAKPAALSDDFLARLDARLTEGEQAQAQVLEEPLQRVCMRKAPRSLSRTLMRQPRRRLQKRWVTARQVLHKTYAMSCNGRP